MYENTSLAEIDEAALQKVSGNDAVCFQHSKQLGHSCVFYSGLNGDVFHQDAAFLTYGQKDVSHLGYLVV